LTIHRGGSGALGANFGYENTITEDMLVDMRPVNGIADLRTLAPYDTRRVYLKYHTTEGDGGNGMFRGVTGAAAATYVDDDNTIVVPTGGDGSAAWLREQWLLKNYIEYVAENAAATGAVTIDLDVSGVQQVTLTGNTTFTFSTSALSEHASSLTLVLIQDGTGSRTVTWPASVMWSDNGTAPTLTTAANTISVLNFITLDGGTTYYGFLSGDAFA